MDLKLDKYLNALKLKFKKTVFLSFSKGKFIYSPKSVKQIRKLFSELSKIKIYSKPKGN